QVLELLVHEDRKERGRVRVLVLRHGGQLHARIEVRDRHRLAVRVPPTETTRSDELDRAHDGGERVLAPALRPDQTHLPVDRILRLGVEGVEPQEDALLLRRQAEPSGAARAPQVGVRPLDNLPPESLVALVLRVDPAVLPGFARLPLWVLLPGASDGVDELQVEVARRHELIGGHLKRRHWPRALRAGRAIAPRAAIFASPAAEAADPSGLGSMRIFMSRRAF